MGDQQNTGFGERQKLARVLRVMLSRQANIFIKRQIKALLLTQTRPEPPTQARIGMYLLPQKNKSPILLCRQLTKGNTERQMFVSQVQMQDRQISHGVYQSDNTEHRLAHSVVNGSTTIRLFYTVYIAQLLSFLNNFSVIYKESELDKII